MTDLELARAYVSKAQSSRSRNIPFELSFAEYKRLRSCKTCKLSGLKLSKDTFSLDRLNSKLGYVKGNVIACHISINNLKGTIEDPCTELSLELCTKALSKAVQLIKERKL